MTKNERLAIYKALTAAADALEAAANPREREDTKEFEDLVGGPDKGYRLSSLWTDTRGNVTTFVKRALQDRFPPEAVSFYITRIQGGKLPSNWTALTKPAPAPKEQPVIPPELERQLRQARQDVFSDDPDVARKADEALRQVKKKIMRLRQPKNQQKLRGAAPLRSLSDLRRAIKALGYGLKIKSYSMFTGSTYVRLSDKKQFPDFFFSEDQRLEWKPLIDFLSANSAAIKAIGKAERISGLGGLD